MGNAMSSLVLPLEHVAGVKSPGRPCLSVLDNSLSSSLLWSSSDGTHANVSIFYYVKMQQQCY